MNSQRVTQWEEHHVLQIELRIRMDISPETIV